MHVGGAWRRSLSVCDKSEKGKKEPARKRKSKYPKNPKLVGTPGKVKMNKELKKMLRKIREGGYTEDTKWDRGNEKREWKLEESARDEKVAGKKVRRIEERKMSIDRKNWKWKKKKKTILY